jgi:hypothetical protein
VEDSDPPLIPLATFAVGFAGVWLTNAPAGVIASYAVALLIAWAALTQRSVKIAVRGACALALGFSITGFYLIPAAYEQRWVNIGQALSSGLLPWQNFLFTAIDDVEHTWFNWIASSCALILVLLFGVAALLSRKFAARRAAGDAGPRVWGALLVVGTAAALLMFRITIPLWNHLPKLRFVQFPWRWMSIIALIFVVFAAAVAEKRGGWLLSVAVVLVSVPLGHFLVSNGWWDTDEMPTQYAAIERGTGFDGTDEYDPLGDDHLDLPVGVPLARILPEGAGNAAAPDARVKIVKWTTEKKELRVDTSREARVALRLLNYPAWKVEVNGKSITPERTDDFAVMVIPVDEGTSVIRVWFARTLDRTIGLWVSALGVMVTMGMLVWGRRSEG